MADLEVQQPLALDFCFRFSFKFSRSFLGHGEFEASQSHWEEEDYESYNLPSTTTHLEERLTDFTGEEEDEFTNSDYIIPTTEEIEHGQDQYFTQSANFTETTMSDGGGTGDTGRSTIPDSSTERPPLQFRRFVELIQSRKIDTALWGSRLITIFLCTFYLIPIPIFGGNPISLYYKALMSNAVTSALRLHQRAPHVSFTRLFLAQILLEDSCHYLFFSIIFLYCQPITLALIPIYLFAILHFASFSLTMLESLGRNAGWTGSVLISLVEYHTVSILRMVAGAEIFTMIFTVIYTVLGRASLVTPFIYYRFLTLRYASRRNHYSRVMFREFRMQLEHIAYSNKCPSILRLLIHKLIELVSRFAPEIVPQTQTN